MVFDCVYGRLEGGCDKPKLSPFGDSTSLYHIVLALPFFEMRGAAPHRARRGVPLARRLL
jgi:hypothetical protein